MALLLDIQNASADGSVSIATLLRKCLILAARLDSSILEDWIKYEMDGYPSDVSVPQYRRIELNFKGTFSGAFGSGITNAPIAPYIVEKHSNNPNISTFHCRQSIASLETLSKGDPQNLRINMDNMGLVLQGKVYPNMALNHFWAEFSNTALIDIENTVRNKILELSLNIWKKYPDAGNSSDSDLKNSIGEEAMTQIFNTTIHGAATVIGTSNQSINHTTYLNDKGNLKALAELLIEKGLNTQDVQELETAIQKDPAPIDKNSGFGPSVAGWITKTIGKAVSGTWKIGIGTGSALLEAALLKYYGLN
ncbi:MAG TPA: hypothetical protein VG519_02680 [Pseudochrobactrum sp.]|nr:hypothetical protein [Pseudochrobactrum sp.]